MGSFEPGAQNWNLWFQRVINDFQMNPIIFIECNESFQKYEIDADCPVSIV